MNDISENISQIALKRRQTRVNSTMDGDYSWVSDVHRKRRSSIIEANPKKEAKGFIAELKSTYISTSSTNRTRNRNLEIEGSNLIPVITCYCNGKEAKALLNSSLTTSTITEEFAEMLKLQDLTTVQLLIGSFKHTQQIRLKSIDYPRQDLCLGVDFLSSSQGIINFKDKCLTLGQENIPFL